MANRNVTVCDMPRGIASFAPPGRMPRLACDRLACDTCGVCHRDVCADHVAFKLAATIANVSPPENPQHQPPKPILECVSMTLYRGICMECHSFFTDLKKNGGQRTLSSVPTLPRIEIDNHLTALLDAIAVEIGSARATLNLTDGPETP